MNREDGAVSQTTTPNADAALATLTDLMQVSLRITAMTSLIGRMVEKARAEGRDLTDTEIDGIRSQDDAARERLAQALRVTQVTQASA